MARKHPPVKRDDGKRMGPAPRQMEHNRILTGLRGMKVIDIELITLEGGTLPTGRDYTGAAFKIDLEDAKGHDTRLILVSAQPDNLEFFLFLHEDSTQLIETSESMAMHACDYLECECQRAGSILSRFRGKNATVYVALDPDAKAHMNTAYESHQASNLAEGAHSL